MNVRKEENKKVAIMADGDELFLLSTGLNALKARGTLEGSLAFRLKVLLEMLEYGKEIINEER